MVTYDKDTKDFIEQVAEGYKKRTPESKVKQALIVSRNLAKSGPEGALSSLLISEGVRSSMNKQSEAKPKILDILALLNDKFEGWDDWEPETIIVELKEELNMEPNDVFMNIVGALQTALNTDYPFEMWHVFENVSHAFNENPVSFSIVQPAELNEIALTVALLKAIRPRTEFVDEVCAYIAASAKNSGVVYLPPELFPAKAQMFLDNLNNDKDLKEEVRKIWPEVRAGEGRLAIQTQRLDEIREYMRDGIKQ